MKGDNSMKFIEKISLVVLMGIHLAIGAAATQPTQETAAAQQVEPPDGVPLCIVLAYNNNLAFSGKNLLSKMIEQENGLLESLNIYPSAEQAYPVNQPVSILKNFKSAAKSNIYETTSSADLVNIINGSRRERPVIVLCDSYSFGNFADATHNLRQGAIHSALIFDPSVGNKTVNFNAIANRVYNFYKASGLAGERKIRPYSNNWIDITTGRSKVINVSCFKELSKEGGEELSFYNFGYWLHRFTPTSFVETFILNANIPKIIQLINDDFIINWDLACVVKADISSYMGPDAHVYMCINRPVLQGLNSLLDTETQPPRTYFNFNLITNAERLSLIKRHIQQETDEFYIFLRDHLETPVGGNIAKKNGLDKNRVISYLKGRNLSLEAKVPDFFDIKTLWVPGQNGEKTYVLVVFIKQTEKGLIKLALNYHDANNKEKQLLHPYHVYLGKGMRATTKMLGEYYHIAKFTVPIDDIENKYYALEVISENIHGRVERRSIAGIAPSRQIMDRPVSFVVYADIQKQQKNFPLNDNLSGSSVKHLETLLSANRESETSLLQLIVGDLVLEGSDFNAWYQIFEYLDRMSTTHQGVRCLVGAAIGSHDFANVLAAGERFSGVAGHVGNVASFFGAPDISSKMKTLYFYDTTPPVFGHIFNFTDPSQVPDTQQKHVLRTHTWFDVGRVRFIHLPYSTEEVALGHQFSDYFLGGLNFDFASLIPQFEQDLKLAYEDRQTGLIDFIVTYGHAPLATSPQYKPSHHGLFNWLADHESYAMNNDATVDLAKPSAGHTTKTTADRKVKKEELSKAELARSLIYLMTYYGVDLHFSGHNHQYDRCSVEFNKTKFKTVTVGLGTELRKGDNATCPGGVQCGTTRSFNCRPGIRIQGTCTLTSEKFISSNVYDNPSNPAENDTLFTLIKEKRIQVNPSHEAFFLPAYLKCTIVEGGRMHCRLLTNEATLDEFYIEPRDKTLIPATLADPNRSIHTMPTPADSTTTTTTTTTTRP